MYLPKDSSKTSRWVRAFYDVCTVSKLRKPHSHAKRPALAIPTSRHVTEARILETKHRATLLLQTHKLLPYVVLSWTVYTHGMSSPVPLRSPQPGASFDAWLGGVTQVVRVPLTARCHNPGLLRFSDVAGVSPFVWEKRRWLKLQSFLCGSWNVYNEKHHQTIHRSATIPWISLIHQWKFLHQELRRASLSIDQEQPNQGHIPKHCVETIVLIWLTLLRFSKLGIWTSNTWSTRWKRLKLHPNTSWNHLTLQNSMLHFQCAIVCASCYKGLLTIDPAGGGGGRVRSNGRGGAGFAGGGGAGGRAVEASTWAKLSRFPPSNIPRSRSWWSWFVDSMNKITRRIWHHVLNWEIELWRSSSNVFSLVEGPKQNQFH